MIEMSIEQLDPLITICCILHTLTNLHKKGVEPKFTKMYIPSVLCHIGSSVVANIVYPQFKISAKYIIIHIISIMLYTLIYKMTALSRIYTGAAIIGKCKYYVALMNSKQTTVNVLSYLIVQDISGRFISYILFEDKGLEMDNKDLVMLLLHYIGLIAGRISMRNDFYMFMYVLILSVIPLFEYNLNKNTKVSRKSAVKTPNESPKKTSKESSPKKATTSSPKRGRKASPKKTL